jgi:lysophospholipase L1-like esterase
MASQSARVLIVGDSISWGYLPHVTKLLEGTATVEHSTGNGGDSANIRKNLDDWAMRSPWNLVHLNCGLHDIKRARPSEDFQVKINDYEANLLDILKRLRAVPNLKVTWATTTPVIDERHKSKRDFDRYNRDVMAYNAVATRIMQDAKVPIVDLYAVVEKAGPERVLINDGVHYTDEGSQILSEPVAALIRKTLGK